MNVAVIGSGGREHAITLKISESKLLENLFIIPGNPGTSSLGKNVNLNPAEQQSLYDFCIENNVELVIVGPEQPLTEGLADFLRERGIAVFGPNKNAAVIEGEKSFSKNLMKKYNVPTAAFEIFLKENKEEALNYLKNGSFPVVIKADGLAAGKGVLICQNFEEASEAIEDCFGKEVFGNAGAKVVIEEFMFGEEASIFAITDSENYILLPSAQDHKRIGNKDTGKNTGGMGAYSPAPVVTDAILHQVEKTIIDPVIKAMKKEGREFNGCLYCGLMITNDGPKVVEFNCRFGDPETQVVLPLLEGDLLELFYSAAKGNINKKAVWYSGGSSVCVVAASGGYPDKFEKGFEITGLEKITDPEIKIFHAGTKKEGDKIVTSGGRVLGVTSVSQSKDLRTSKEKAYEALNKINFKNIYYRTDIADKGIAKGK